MRDYKQGDASVSDYINGFSRLYKVVQRAGGDHSQQQLIQECLKNSSGAMQKAFNAHIQMQATRGEYNQDIFKHWGMFANSMESIGRSMILVGDDGVVRTGIEHLDEDKPRKVDCNNWIYTGQCAYGDSCKFSHDAEAGCKRSNARAVDLKRTEIQQHTGDWRNVVCR